MILRISQKKPILTLTTFNYGLQKDLQRRNREVAYDYDNGNRASECEDGGNE